MESIALKVQTASQSDNPFYEIFTPNLPKAIQSR